MASNPRGKSNAGQYSLTPRGLARLLDGSQATIWLIDDNHRIAWMNDACGRWLGIDPASLVGRLAVTAHESNEPLDRLAADLAAPLSLAHDSSFTIRVEPENRAARYVRFVMLSTEVDVDANASAIVLAIGYHEPPEPKPTDDAESKLQQRLQAKLHHWRRRDSAYGGIAAAGTSRQSHRLRSQIHLATSVRTDFAIVGPPGCGAESIARRIHASRESAQVPPPSASSVGPNTNPGSQGRTLRIASEPLIVIDGPLMDAELLEAALSPAAAFLDDESSDNHPRQQSRSQATDPAVARGDATSTATSGSHPPRWITLLVRSLDETPLDVQARLQQFMQDAQGQVRLIALLSQTIGAAMSKEKVISSLAARLEPLCIEVTPLASRIEDVPLMAAALVDLRHAAGSTAQRFSRAALDRLMIYPWPRNFDELDAAVRHATSICSGASIGPEHLPLAIRSYQSAEPHDAAMREVDLDREVERFQNQLIATALKIAGGNRSEAARRLGISRARLLRLLESSGSLAADDHEESADAPPHNSMMRSSGASETTHDIDRGSRPS